MGTATLQTRASDERFVRAAWDAGCPREQLENFIRAGVVLQPRQLAFSAAARRCDRAGAIDEILFGGAMGGGKSHGLLAQLGCDDCQRQAGLKCLLLRKVGKANKENFEDLRQRLFMRLPHTYRSQATALEFANGSRILAGHFQKESDVDAYLGLEYDVIAVEEATTLSSSKLKMIRTRCRTSKPDWRPRLYFTANPGGVSHGYFKKLFVDPWRKGTQGSTCYVPATVYDNAFINPEYRGRLETLTGWQKKAWLLGDWDIAAGQFFTTFRYDTHVIKPFAVPTGWRKWGALDYGFTHYTTAYLLSQSGDGDIYVMDEHARQQWLPQRHAPAIDSMLGRNAVKPFMLSKFVAGADVFAKKEHGGTIADTYKGLGLHLVAANDDRINGAGEILTRLGDVDAGIRPSLFIFDRCAMLIEQLPALEHDPHRPEDVLKVDVDEDGNGGDDAYDGARYGIMEGAKKPSGMASGAQNQTVTGYKPR